MVEFRLPRDLAVSVFRKPDLEDDLAGVAGLVLRGAAIPRCGLDFDAATGFFAGCLAVALVLAGFAAADEGVTFEDLAGARALIRSSFLSDFQPAIRRR